MHDHNAAQAKYRKTPRGIYQAHKVRAKRSGIEWAFTFDGWWEMWEPHWDNKSGHRRDGLVMCRHCDEGPYSAENCRIDTVYNNAVEATDKQWGRMSDG